MTLQFVMSERVRQSVMDSVHMTFAFIFLGGSLGGLAALLRTNKNLSWRNIVSAMLNSGIITLVIGLVWYKQYAETNLYFLLGVSLLAGLGGATTIDFVTLYIRQKFLHKDD